MPEEEVKKKKPPNDAHWMTSYGKIAKFIHVFFVVPFLSYLWKDGNIMFFFRVVWMCNNVYTNFLQSYFTFFPFTYDGCLLPQFVLFAFPFLTTLLLLLLYFINLINSFAIHPIRLLSGAHTQFVFIDIEMGNNITMSNKMLYRQRMETERKKSCMSVCTERVEKKHTPRTKKAKILLWIIDSLCGVPVCSFNGYII